MTTAPDRLYKKKKRKHSILIAFSIFQKINIVMIKIKKFLQFFTGYLLIFFYERK